MEIFHIIETTFSTKKMKDVLNVCAIAKVDLSFLNW